MSQLILDETFDGKEMDGRLRWHNPPMKWSLENSCLVVQPEAKTDFWQKTHYGFSADNGHLLYLEVEGDIVLSTRVRFYPAHQYDQAGLMAYFSPECWLKTSVEYELDEPSKLGAVVTNRGYSDWSTQDFPAGVSEVELRLRREGSDIIVEYCMAGATAEAVKAWTQIRMAHLDASPETPMRGGLYACSPIEAGYRAEFDYLRIEEGKV